MSYVKSFIRGIFRRRKAYWNDGIAAAARAAWRRTESAAREQRPAAKLTGTRSRLRWLRSRW